MKVLYLFGWFGTKIQVGNIVFHKVVIVLLIALRRVVKVIFVSQIKIASKIVLYIFVEVVCNFCVVVTGNIENYSKVHTNVCYLQNACIVGTIE